VQNPDLAARLREISEYKLGRLIVGSLPDAEQQDPIVAVRELPAIARAELPATSEGEAAITQIG
jgi:hypothetical protein